MGRVLTFEGVQKRGHGLLESGFILVPDTEQEFLKLCGGQIGRQVRHIHFEWFGFQKGGAPEEQVPLRISPHDLNLHADVVHMADAAADTDGYGEAGP